MTPFPFPVEATKIALFYAAGLVQAAWIEAADAAQAPDAYVQGLQGRGSLIYPLNGDDLAAEVRNLAAQARRMEDGMPAYHLPSVMHWPTPKSRRGKHGYYLIIPFRHGTPGAQAGSSQMSRRVYAVARQLQPGQRLTAGPLRGGAVHAPGMQPYAPRNPLNVRPGQRASLQEGLQRTPGTRGSTYGTFRTMKPTSPGWNMPARPGLHLIPQVVRDMTPQITKILETALRADIQAALTKR